MIKVAFEDQVFVVPNSVEPLGDNGFMLFVQPASAATLGGVDVLGYCKSQFGMKNLVGTRVGSRAAFSWRCTYLGLPLPYGVDMSQACQFTVRNQDAYAVLRDRKNAYSWSCRL